MLVDCDGDSLIYVSKATGPACHTGARSCYFRLLDGGAAAREEEGGRAAAGGSSERGASVAGALPTLLALEQTIRSRALADTDAGAAGSKPSWTARLLRDPALTCSKVREEAGELCRTWEDGEGAWPYARSEDLLVPLGGRGRGMRCCQRAAAGTGVYEGGHAVPPKDGYW